MNDLSLHDAERIIEAAAAGESLADHEAVGGFLTSLHAPAGPTEALGSAPTLRGGGDGVVARLTRRTAVAASVAVLGVAGVAAAATGGVELLDPVLGDDAPVVIVEDVVEEEGGVEAGAEGEQSPDSDAAPEEIPEESDGGEGAEAGSDRPHPRDPVEGVDLSDGLDETDLPALCAGAVNHGQYVSTIARHWTPGPEETRGDVVSRAAHEDCPSKDDGEAEEPAADDDEVAPEGDIEAPDEEDGDRPGNGRGNANAHGHDRSDDAGRGNGRALGHAKNSP